MAFTIPRRENTRFYERYWPALVDIGEQVIVEKDGIEARQQDVTTLASRRYE
jgi:hypothetical protein